MRKKVPLGGAVTMYNVGQCTLPRLVHVPRAPGSDFNSIV